MKMMATMKAATKVKDLDGFTGNASLYVLSDPVEYGFDEDKNFTNYVVVSATYVMFSGPETYIFPANKSGEIEDWCELNGSFKGGRDHKAALENAGFIVQAG